MPILPIALIEKIRKVIKDYPTDMLMRLPITIQKRNLLNLDRFGENSEINFTNYELLGLQKEFNQSSDISQEKNIGKIDLADGYFLFNFDDLEDKGLIENNLPTIDITDYCFVNGVKYEITSVHLLGQLVDKFTLVKVIVKKVILMI